MAGFQPQCGATTNSLKILWLVAERQGNHKGKSTNEAKRLLKTKQIALLQIAIAKRCLKIQELFL
jgi:hypothetical protein